MSQQFTFSWPSGPQKVIITGNFDEWKGSLPLVKQADGSFQITMPVEFGDDESKFYFKFIVDDEWVTSENFPRELDIEKHVENNYIVKGDLVKALNASSGAQIPEAGGLVAQAPVSTAKQTKNQKKKAKKKASKKKKAAAAAAAAAVAASGGVASGTVELEDASVSNTDDVTASSKDVTPAPENETVNILPVKDIPAPTSIAAGMGPVIVDNPEQVKEFNEVSDVNAKDLNEKLNKEIEEKQKKDVEEPVVEEPVVEESVVEEPVVEEATVEEPVVEEPVVEEPVVEESVVEEPVVEEATVEEPVVEEPVVEEPVVEEPVVSSNLDPKAQKSGSKEAGSTDEVKPKSESKPKNKVKKTPKPVVEAEPVEELKPKKKGFFGKLKKLFG